MRAHLGCILAAAMVHAIGSAGARAAPVTTDFVLWLDASDVQTIADGEGDNPNDGVNFDGTVQTWLDKSGTANHATAAVSRPTFVPGTLNGAGVVRFNPMGGTQSLDTANTHVLTGETMFFVTKMNDDGDGRGGWVGSTSTQSSFKNDDDRYFLQKDDGDDGRIANNAPQAYQLVTETRLVVNDGFAPFGVLEDGATLAPIGAASRSGDVTINSIGRTNGLYFSGDMAEVLIYDRTLNTAERVITENYLASKWGITMADNDRYAGDTVSNGDYDFDVFGIGQDVVTSAPRDPDSVGDVVNISPAGKLASSAGGGIALAEANASLADGEYLLAGHDGAAHSLVASDLPASAGQRWARVFYLDVTGELDAVLSFDFASAPELGMPNSPAGYTLLYRSGTSGMFTDLQLTGQVSGSLVQFNLNGMTDANDGFYTLGVNVIPEPSTMLACAIVLGLVPRRRSRGVAR